MQVKTDAPAPRQSVSQNESQPKPSTSARLASAAEASPAAILGARPEPAESGLGLADSTRAELRALQQARVQANLDLERLQSARGPLTSLNLRLGEMSAVARDAASPLLPDGERPALTMRYRGLAEAAEAIHAEVRHPAPGSVTAGSEPRLDPARIDAVLSEAANSALDSASAGHAAHAEALNLADRVSALASSYALGERQLEGRIARAEAGIANLESASSTLEHFEDADRAARLTRDQILDLQTRSWAGHGNLSPARALALLED